MQRPMKGDNAKDKLDQLKWPAWCSVKIDGIRAACEDGVLLSNTLKPLPNLFTQLRFKDCHGLDGELVCGAPNDANCMQNTSSAVMSKAGEPNVKYYVFDYWPDDSAPYESRMLSVQQLIAALNNPHMIIVKQYLIHSLEEFMGFEDWALSEGYEGVMYRRAANKAEKFEGSKYKFGRSTIKEGYLLKVKRMIDGEAVIVGFKQMESNQNAATTDARGLTKRSSEKSGMVLMDTLGAFVCRDLKTGEQFSVIGGTADQRSAWWHDRANLLGKIIRYQSLPTGVVDKPRSPVLGKKFDGFRDPIDIEDYDQDHIDSLIARGVE